MSVSVGIFCERSKETGIESLSVVSQRVSFLYPK